MAETKKQNFLQGALVLSLATAVVKIIGAMYKIPLSNMLGPESMAHFGVAYEIYSTLFVVSTAGLPVAISKMVAKAEVQGRTDESKRIFKVAMLAFVLIGLAGTGVLFFGAQSLADFMGDPEAFAAIRAIAPAVFFVAYMSAFRGFFQGQGNMVPTAVSQVYEASGKLIIGYGLAYFVFNTTHDLALSAAAAIGGVSCGTVFGSAFVTWRGRKLLHRERRVTTLPTRSGGSIFKELMGLAIPITISSSVLTLTNLLDTGLIMRRLQDVNGANFSYELSLELYGSYNFAKTMFNLPSAFILTLAVSVIPVISAAMTRKDYKTASGTVDTAVGVTALLALPASAGLMCLSGPILRLMYPDQLKAAEIATPLLFTLGIAITFVCLVPLTNAMLQSMGRTQVPLVSMSVGAIIKIVSNFVLVGNPDINIYGAPVGTVFCYLAIAGINIGVIIRTIHPKRILTCFVKPLLASAIMGVAAYYLQVALLPVMGNTLSTIAAILVAVILYVVLIVVFKALKYQDVMLLPKGEKIAQVLKITEKM